MYKKNSLNSWVMLTIMFLSCCIGAFVQFQATAYADDLMTMMNINAQQYATIALMPMMGGLLISFLSGVWADRFGVHKTMTILYFLGSFAALSRCWAKGFFVLAVASCAMGFAGASANAINSKVMSSWFDGRNLGLAIGIMVSSGNFGTIAAMSLGRGLSSDANTAFFYGGLLSCVIALLWLFLGKDNNSAVVENSNEKPDLKGILTNKTIWLAALGAALFMGCNMAMSTLISPGLLARGFSEGVANLTVICVAGGNIFSQIFLPNIISSAKNKKVLSCSLAIAAAVFVNVGWLVNSNILRFIFIFLTALCFGGLLSVFMGTPATCEGLKENQIGAASGLIATIMMGGSFIIPTYIITPIAGGINNMTFILAGVCALAVALICYILNN